MEQPIRPFDLQKFLTRNTRLHNLNPAGIENRQPNAFAVAASLGAIASPPQFAITATSEPLHDVLQSSDLRLPNQPPGPSQGEATGIPPIPPPIRPWTQPPDPTFGDGTFPWSPLDRALTETQAFSEWKRKSGSQYPEQRHHDDHVKRERSCARRVMEEVTTTGWYPIFISWAEYHGRREKGLQEQHTFADEVPGLVENFIKELIPHGLSQLVETGEGFEREKGLRKSEVEYEQMVRAGRDSIRI